MRREVVAQGSTLTVGELREALNGVDEAAPVYVEGWFLTGAVGSDLSLELLSEGIVEEVGRVD